MAVEVQSEWASQMYRVFPYVIMSTVIAWIIYVKTKISCTVDVFWVLNNFLVTSIFFVMNWSDLTLKMLLAYILVLIWFVRLGNYLLLRFKAGLMDERYERLYQKRQSMNKDLYFLQNYFAQALIIMVVTSLNFWTFKKHSNNNGTFVTMLNTIVFAFGQLLSVKGVVLEAAADNQLDQWKISKQRYAYVPGPGGHSKEEQEHENLRKKFNKNCIDGEWAKCRHPNLFHELEFWFGIAFCSQDFGMLLSILAFVGPCALLLIMVKVTIPLTDSVMKHKRTEYWAEYTKTFPSLLPKKFF